MPQGQYRDALNALLTKRKGAVCSDEGAELESDITVDSLSLTTGLQVIGSTSVYDNTHILFLTDGTNSEIGLYDGTSYSTVVSDASLNFTIDSVIEAVAIINNRDQIVVYWTDNINPPRFFNVTQAIEDGVTAIEDISSTRLFPQIDSVPILTFNQITTGGSLVTGTYHFAIRLIAEDDSKTGFMSVTQPIYINDDEDVSDPDNYDGAPSETSTSKSITIDVNGLDQNYDRYEIAVIRKQDNSVVETILLDERSIGSTSDNFTYDGTTGIDLSLEEVFINTASYQTARSIAEIDNTLYLGNLSQTSNIDYQKFANNIKVSAVTKELNDGGTGIESREHYGNQNIAFFDKAFKRGEVYALYISFVLEDGNESEAFHIPGRAPEGTETNGVSGDGNLEDIDPDGFEYQFLSSSGANNMAYWENEDESYPNTDDWDIFDVDSNGDPVDTGSSLRGLNVRHHHFPDDLTDAFRGDSVDSHPVTLGFSLSDVKIPSSIIDRVKAVKVYYAKRTPINKRLLDQGFVFPLTPHNLDLPVDDDFWIYNPADSVGNDLDSITAVIMDGFHSVRTLQNIAVASYLKLISIPQGDASNPTGSGDDDEVFWDQKETIGSPPADQFYPISAKTYIGKNEIIEATNDGFSFDIYNEEGEQGIAMELSQPIDFSHVTDYSRSATNSSIGFIGEICAVRNNLYRPFDQQELIWTGYIETNVDRFNPAGSSGTDSFAEGEIHVLTGSNDVPDTQATCSSEITAGADADGGTLVITYDGNSVNVVLSGSETIDQVGSAIETDVNADGTITLSVSYDTGTNVLTFTADDGEEDENGKTVTIDVADTGVTVSDTSPDMSGGDSIDDLIVTLDTETITVVTPNNDTAENVAIAINDAINAQSTNYSSTVSTTIISIVANNVGTEYNGNIFVTEGDTGVTTDDTDLLGGSSASETSADFAFDNIFGGDIFIVRHGTRRTGWNLEDAAGDDFPDQPWRQLIDYVVESVDNIKFRHQGTESWQIYYPKSAETASPEYGTLRLEDTHDPEGFGVANYIAYNEDYSALAEIKTPTPKLKDADNILNFPTRIIRSVQGDSNIGNDEGLRTFLENDFIDLSRKRGPITTLSVMDNILIPHMERAMVRTKGREEMVVGDIRAFIGAGDIFSVNPDEILYTETGFAGLQDQKCNVVTPYGYFFVDRTAGKVFLVGEGPEVISDNGLNNFFQEELSGASAGDLICTWDNKWDRIILTYKNNWTLSYYPQLKAWGSFHSFNPDYYFYGIDTFFAINGDELYKHNVENVPCTYYGTQYNFEYEIIENRQAPTTKTFANIQFITEVEDASGNVIFNETFDQYRIFTDLQDSGVRDIIYFTNAGGNARNVEGTWKINDFRNMLVGGVVDTNKPWQDQDRIRDKWAALRLIFNNTDNKSLYLYDIDMGVKISRR